MSYEDELHGESLRRVSGLSSESMLYEQTSSPSILQFSSSIKQQSHADFSASVYEFEVKKYEWVAQTSPAIQSKGKPTWSSVIRHVNSQNVMVDVVGVHSSSATALPSVQSIPITRTQRLRRFTTSMLPKCIFRRNKREFHA